MSKLKDADIDHVAKLAKLDLTPNEIEKFKGQLSKVILYFDELNEVGTSKVAPTSQTTGLENVTRKDEIAVKGQLSQKQALSGTEKTHNGYFKVPMILEERTV